MVELDATAFDAFVNDPLRDQDFITENKEMMCQDPEGAYHCLLVLGAGRADGVLGEAEGYDFARYAAYVPHARAYIEQESRHFADECMGITPNEDGSISVYLEDIENYTGASVDADNCLAQIFCEPGGNNTAEASRADCYGCISITPGQNMAADNRLRDAEERANTLDEILGAVSNHIGSEKLYEILRQDSQLSDEKITGAGFDLEDYYPAEQPEAGQDMTL